MDISTNVFRLLWLGALFACALLAHAQSAPMLRGGSDPIIFESRPPGQAGGGIVIGDVLFPGQTFRLHQRTHISALGLGNLGVFVGTPGEAVFAALYQIDTPDGVPDVVGESGLLGVTLLEVPSTRADVTGALSLVVEPGIYAIVTGTERHGAAAGALNASLENAGTSPTPDTWSHPYSVNSETGARSLQGATIRFFIEGQTLPPSPPPPDEFLVETARPTAWWAQSAFWVDGTNFRGARFEVTRPTRVDQGGSWLRSGGGDVFAAIVAIDGPEAFPLPVNHPGFMDAVAGATLIGVGNAPRAYTGEFEDVELAPGHYALILGSGLFGAGDTATIMTVADQIVIEETLNWNGSFWGTHGQNFRMFLSGEVLFPAVEVIPGALDFEIHQGDAGSAALSVGNTGEADLDWSIMISEAAPAAGSRDFEELHEGFENVSQLPAAGWVRINNSEPPGTPGWFQGGSYPAHQGPANSYISAAWHNTEGPNGVISNWLLTPEIDLSEGVQLRFWTRVPTNSCCPDRLEVRLSTSGDSTDAGDSEFSTGDFGTRLLTVNESLVQGGYPQEWTEFIVTVPAQGASTGGRLAFRYFVTEAGSQSPNSNWLSIDSVSITQWDGGPVCTGPAEIPWLSVSPDTGTAPPDGSSDIDVAITTAGLAEGEYSAQLCVSSNDPDNPLAAVPVSLTVMPPRTPELVFDPPALDFADVNLGATGGPLTATLSNAGNADAAGLSFALGGDFGVHYNDCGNALPAGGDCQVGIVFAPEQEGAASGMLDVAADGGFTAALALSGNGVDAPAPALEYGPESFAFELFPGENDSRELVIGNPGAGDLIWSLDTDVLAVSGARGHDPSLDEPIAIPDFEIDSAANGGQPAIFTLPAAALSRGEVVGFSFTGTVSGITGTPSRAYEMCMFVTAPDGTSHAVGGYFTVPGCGLDSWDFTNDAGNDGTYSSSHDGVFDPPQPDDGAWTFTFHNAWHSTAAATMAWSDVTVTLHKRPVPCLSPSEVEWLNVSPASGTTPPAGSDTVDVSVDAGGLGEGSYAASLCVSSNDPDTPLAVVPVALRIEAPAPAMEWTPGAFEFEIPQGDGEGDVLAVTNTGRADLEWSLFDPQAGAGDPLILLDEDFEDGFLPSGWNAVDDGNLSCPWRTSDDYGMDGWIGTARGAVVDSDHCFDGDVPFNSVNASLVSPPLNLADVDNARLDFELAYRHLGLSRLRLEISTDDGADWTVLRTWSSHFAYPGNPSLPVSVDLSEYDGESHVLLRWRYRAGWDWWAFVDNVVVSADPPENCYDPAAHAWLEVEPTSGVVAPDGSVLMELQVDTAQLPTGAYAAELCIHGNVPGHPLVAVPVALSVVAPELTLDPPSLDFGEILLGTPGAPETATLHNTGNAGATELVFNFDGGAFGLDMSDCGAALPAGESCEIEVTFLPNGLGAANGLLEVASDEGAVAELQLTGTGVAAILELEPASFSFELITGQNETRELTIGNAGNIDLDWTITAESECGAGGSADWLNAAPQSGTTAAGGAVPVEIIADAAGLAAGQYGAVLCIDSNALEAPQTGIPVSLTVTAPDLRFEPSALDFEEIEIGAGGLTLHATLHNGGDSDATELDFLVPAGFSADTVACGATLPTGGECEIAVTFAPSEIGTVEGTLIAGGAKGAAAELALSGKGIEFGTLGVDPDQLHFADVVVTTSRTLAFNVTNTAGPGANNLGVSAISLESGAPAFAINRIDCAAGTVLPPGESCVVEITFTPVQVAVHEGAVRVGASDGQQIKLTLSGTVLGDGIFKDRFE